MIKLINYNKKYDSKLIMKFDEFEAMNSQITILYGESGCGKTTLLNSINSSEYSYKLDDIIINKDNVRRYVSYAPQVPIFIDTLTVKDNILFYLSLNKKDLDDDLFEDLNSKLNLKYLMVQYPKSLSGGELRRISLITAILLDKPVILLDEPTASLDEEYVDVIKDILLSLKEKGKTIIISTHDESMKLIGDRIYELKDSTIHLRKDSNKTNDNQEEVLEKKISYKRIYSLIRKRKKYYKIKNSFITLMTIVIVLLLGFSTIYGKETINGLKNWLSNSVPDKMVVCKKISEGTDDYDPFQAPLLEKEELDYLSNHQYINEIRNFHNGVVNDQQYNNIIVIDDNGNEKEIELDINVTNINYSTYYKDEDYSKDILKKYNDHGVYISQELADYLEISENNCKIGFYLAIPNRISSPGGYMSYAQDTTKYYHVDMMGCVYEYVEMDIAGIYKNYYMGLYTPSAANGNGRIYIEYELYESYIEKHKLEEAYVEECFNKVVCKQANIYPYEATSYIVSYDVGHVEELLNDLYEHDFRFVNDYYDTESLLKAQQQNSMMITTFSVIVFIVGGIIILSIKYVQRNETKQVYQVMTSQSVTRKYYYKIMSLLWVEDTIFVSIISTILAYGLSLILNSFMLEYTNFNLLSILTFLLVSIVVCFIIPMLSDILTLRYEK